MRPGGILETVVYAEDLHGAQAFYSGALGLECTQKEPGRHIFFRCGNQMLLVFNPVKTRELANTTLPVPPHGASGAGHVCFRATAAELDAWRQHFEERGIAIEADFEWPRGGRSIYVRDPAGNSVEFAEPRIWGLS
jgi:catechol 2,3-dioxygenase-like lactoylglutathione lyase family enzyme